MRNINVAVESVKSLYVRSMREAFDGTGAVEIASGTAFVVEHSGEWFLLTNLHVLTGRDPITGSPMGYSSLPTSLAVWHNDERELGQWVQMNYSLYDAAGRACWLEHPKDPSWDVVALQILPRDGIALYTYDLPDENDRLLNGPGSDLSIVGFPFGKAVDGRFAIWNRATIASDIDLDYDSRPAFLVDSRSRPGQSGSPVIAKTNGMAIYTNGNTIMDGSIRVELMGIYSGRISPESDLGIVWKVHVIRDLITIKRRSTRRIDD